MANRKRKLVRKKKRTRSSLIRKYRSIASTLSNSKERLSGDKQLPESQGVISPDLSQSSRSADNSQYNIEPVSPITLEEIDNIINELVESSKNSCQDFTLFEEYNFPAVSLPELVSSGPLEPHFEIDDYPTYLNL